jgi:hypothetical protein
VGNVKCTMGCGCRSCLLMPAAAAAVAAAAAATTRQATSRVRNLTLRIGRGPQTDAYHPSFLPFMYSHLAEIDISYLDGIQMRQALAQKHIGNGSPPPLPPDGSGGCLVSRTGMCVRTHTFLTCMKPLQWTRMRGCAGRKCSDQDR